MYIKNSDYDLIDIINQVYNIILNGNQENQEIQISMIFILGIFGCITFSDNFIDFVVEPTKDKIIQPKPSKSKVKKPLPRQDAIHMGQCDNDWSLSIDKDRKLGNKK